MKNFCKIVNFIFYFLIFLQSSIGSKSYRLSRARQPEVRLLEGYRSPLDEGFPPDYYYESGEKLPNNEEDIVDVDNNNNGETSSSSNTLPLCQRECLGKFSEAAKAAIQSSSNFERYRGVCL